jgi:ribonuclease HI
LRAVEKEIKLSKLARECLKLNVDASFHENGRGAAGIVLCTDHGEAIAGYACPLDRVLKATSAETLALKKGLELLESMSIGMSKVTIESDSLELI